MRLQIVKAERKRENTVDKAHFLQKRSFFVVLLSIKKLQYYSMDLELKPGTAPFLVSLARHPEHDVDASRSEAAHSLRSA